MVLTNVFFKNLDCYVNKVRYIVNQGGTSASKTYSVLQLLFYIILKSKKKLKITIVSQTYQHLKDGVIYDFQRIIENENINFNNFYNKSEHTFYLNDSILQFISLDKPSKALGSRRDILYINECNYIDFDVFEQLEVRTKGTIFLDYNPVARFWVHDEILPRENAILLKSTYLDNLKNLNDEIIKSIEAKKNKKNWWQIYGLGEIGFSEDLIFQESNLKYFNINEINISETTNVCYVDTADAGSDYFCAVFGGVSKSDVYVFDVIFNQNILSINDEYLIEKCKRNNVKYLIIETNKEGGYFFQKVTNKLKNTNVFPVFNTQNKIARILDRAGSIIDSFYFLKDVEKNTEYYNYFQNLLSFSINGKNKHDDAPDATAGLTKFCNNYFKI